MTDHALATVQLPTATALQRLREAGSARFDTEPFDRAVLAHDERHLRRKSIRLEKNGRLTIDLPEAVLLEDGDRLLLGDGRQVEIRAAEEELLEVRGRDSTHLVALAWHIGNRHLPAEVRPDSILILRDHVIGQMLVGLGAALREVKAPFHPLRGAYGERGHVHHGHAHRHPGARDDHSHSGHGHG